MSRTFRGKDRNNWRNKKKHKDTDNQDSKFVEPKRIDRFKFQQKENWDE